MTATGTAGQGAILAAIEVAEAQLHEIAEEAKAVYRRYRDLDTARERKADEIKELRRQLRETKTTGQEN